MDDDDFDDLLAGVEVFSGSSQESLTSAAAKLGIGVASQSTAPTSIDSQRDTSLTSDCLNEYVENSTVSHHSHVEPTTPKDTPTPALTVHTVAEKIENIFRDISNVLQSKTGQLSITIRTRPANAQNQSSLRKICFPGRTAEEAWRFTVVVRILELMHDAIRTGVVLSKRDVYYRDPALFGSQAVVNRYVDSIAYTFNVPRAMLNVTAAAKGLVAGAFTICRRDGSMIDATGEKEGLLVPMLRDVLSIDLSAVKWILVIEKEASFRSIAASGFWDQVSTHGVIITGKGYPDIATRALLHYMSTASPQNGFASPPVFCLVDFDPDGLSIMQTYKHGSAALVHQNENLYVSQLQWLGLRSEDLGGGANDIHRDQGLLELTPRDRRKALNMLERSEPDAADEDELEARSALQTMLMLNTKAELQLLDADSCGMADLLTSAVSGLEQ